VRWLLLLLLLVRANAWCQGLVIFNNRVQNEIVAPIYNLEPANPALPKLGNPASGIPTGTQIYNGVPLAGTNFTAQLFGGTKNTPLAPLWPQANFRSGDAAGFVVAPNVAVSVPGVREGERARLQLRVWNNRGGTVTNWSQVLADPTIPHGESGPFVSLPLGSVFTPPPNLVGLQSFNLVTPVLFSSPKYTPQVRFQFQYLNASAISYRIQASETLTNWTTLTTILPGTGTITHVFTHNSPRQFYRAVPAQNP
jgi:hypothetical protein